MSLMSRRISSRPTNILALRQQVNLQRWMLGHSDLKSKVSHNHLEKLRSETSSANWCPFEVSCRCVHRMVPIVGFVGRTKIDAGLLSGGTVFNLPKADFSKNFFEHYDMSLL